MIDYAALGLSPPLVGYNLNLDDDPDFEARWYLTAHLPRLGVLELRRFGSRWAGIASIGLRPWDRNGPNPSSFCIVTGTIWTRGSPVDGWDQFWEYPDLNAANAALAEWNGEGEPPNFKTRGI